MSDLISIDYTHHESLTTDLISREDAIEALNKLDSEATEYVVNEREEVHGFCTAVGVCVGAIALLPSAGQVTGKLKKPCDSLLTEDTAERKEQKSKLDFIRRQDAVNEIHKYFVEEINKTPYTKDEDGDEVYTDISTVNSLLACNKELSKRIESLPSASVEVGEWIPVEEVWANVQPLKDKILDLEEKLYLQKDRQNGGWIPCSERLPSEHGLYLVTYDDDIGMMWYGEPFMPNIKVNKGEKYFYRSDSEWGDIIYEEVTAWMPLPKPYEGSESDEGHNINAE